MKQTKAKAHASAHTVVKQLPPDLGEAGELEGIQLPPKKKTKTEMVSVRLDEFALKDLTQLADKQGVGVSTLIRMWTLQRLASEAPREGSPWVE